MRKLEGFQIKQCGKIPDHTHLNATTQIYNMINAGGKGENGKGGKSKYIREALMHHKQ